MKFVHIFIALVVYPTVSYSTIVAGTFTDRMSWEASASTAVTFFERFDDQNFGVITDGEAIAYDNGFSLIGDGAGGLAIYRTSNGVFNTGHIDTDFESTDTRLIFQFDQPIYGFGFD